MTEQEFQGLFYKLRGILGLNDNKARLAATWTLAARGFVANAVGCLPHLVFVAPPKAARDRAVSLVAESINDLLVDLTRPLSVAGSFGSKTMRNSRRKTLTLRVTCCCGPTCLCAAPCSWAADGRRFSQTRRRRLSSVLTFGLTSMAALAAARGLPCP
jgi:hypothetical protein